MVLRTKSVTQTQVVAILESLPQAEVLHIYGDADIATSNELQRAIAEIHSPLPVIVDLTECRFIDTTAITVLIRAYRRLGGGSRLRVVVSAQSHVERVFQVVHLSEIMPVSNSVEESLVA